LPNFWRSAAARSHFPKKVSREEAHARIVAALDAVAARSQETGPAVSKRNHDVDLYGKR
jgi:hypothetical protein